MAALFRLFPVDPVLAAAAVLATAMPGAVNNFILARGMGLDSDYASEIIAATVMLSSVTIPLWISWV